MATSSIRQRDYKEWLKFCEQVQNSTGVAPNESEKDREDRKRKATRNYNEFVKTYFPIYASSDCGYFHIQAAKELKKDRNAFMVLEWPREHAKSVHANIFYPMYLLALGELDGMILMGKNEDDAKNLLADLQAQLQYNQLYINDFGDQFNAGSWTEGDFTTVSGIRFLAIGRDQSPRGARKNEKRPNYAVIDDIDDDIIVNNERRVLEVVDRILGALYFALSIKGARVVMAGNRIHPRSILAHIVGDIKPGSPKRPGIKHIKVFATEGKRGKKLKISEGGTPAWKERYTTQELQDKMDKAGPAVSGREFYHEHTVEGKIFKEAFFQWRKLPKLSKYQVIVGYFDPSFENKVTSDFKAVRVWGLYNNKEKHCIKSFVRKTELVKCFLFMGEFEASLPSGVGVIWYVENQFFNRPVRDAVAEAEKILGRKLNVIADHRKKENKYVRMVKMEPAYFSGNVYYNEDEKYNADMIEGNTQVKGIEPGYKTPDDAPDADEGAFYYLDQHITSESVPAAIGRHTRRKLY